MEMKKKFEVAEVKVIKFEKGTIDTFSASNPAPDGTVLSVKDIPFLQNDQKLQNALRNLVYKNGSVQGTGLQAEDLSMNNVMEPLGIPGWSWYPDNVRGCRDW